MQQEQLRVLHLRQKRDTRRCACGYPGCGYTGCGYPGCGYTGCGYPGCGYPGYGYPIGPGHPLAAALGWAGTSEREPDSP